MASLGIIKEEDATGKGWTCDRRGCTAPAVLTLEVADLDVSEDHGTAYDLCEDHASHYLALDMYLADENAERMAYLQQQWRPYK